MNITEECSEIRSINCQLGLLSRPDGSATLSLGKTVVLAAVYGPVEVKPQKLMIEKSHIEVHYKPSSGVPGLSDRLKESTICKIFQVALLSSLHPRTCISIIVQEMQDAGGLLACAINAACLALINSGISMKFLVAAVSCMIDSSDNIILDPDNRQIKESKAVFTFVFESIQQDVIATETSGAFTTEQFHNALHHCKTTSLSIFAFYRNTVKKYADSIALT